LAGRRRPGLLLVGADAAGDSGRPADACPAARPAAAQAGQQPKWGRNINWSARDDAALLLGVYMYGLGNWDAVAADPGLQLGDKIASARRGASCLPARLPLQLCRPPGAPRPDARCAPSSGAADPASA
jgi:hypothetical protein